MQLSILAWNNECFYSFGGKLWWVIAYCGNGDSIIASIVGLSGTNADFLIIHIIHDRNCRSAVILHPYENHKDDSKRYDKARGISSVSTWPCPHKKRERMMMLKIHNDRSPACKMYDIGESLTIAIDSLTWDLLWMEGCAAECMSLLTRVCSCFDCHLFFFRLPNSTNGYSWIRISI